MVLKMKIIHNSITLGLKVNLTSWMKNSPMTLVQVGVIQELTSTEPIQIAARVVCSFRLRY